MAGALGRCLLRALAAGGRTPVVDQPVISVPDPELVRVSTWDIFLLRVSLVLPGVLSVPDPELVRVSTWDLFLLRVSHVRTGVLSVPDPELVRVRVRKMIICCAPAVHL